MRWGTLFSGVGGTEWGLAAAGHQVIWAVEHDAIAAEYHRINHPGVTLYEADVQDVDVSELANIDCLWASPPCQSHSDARRKDLPARDDAWVGRDILRYARELEPRVIMIENVPGYRRHPVYREIVTGLVDLGYTVEARLLNCADYGIPQTRERLIVQARRDGRIAWPRPSARRVGWYEAIADLINDMPMMDGLRPWQERRWKPIYDAMLPVYIDSQFAHHREWHRQRELTIRAADEPAPTVVASHNQSQKLVKLADGTLRKLTPQANARLQTLPDGAVWPDVLKDAHRVIGNAVPSRLAQLPAEATEAPQVWNVSLWGSEDAA